jgi:thymidylate kinase
MRGRLIIVEGLDGTGKTTLSQGLAQALGAQWLTTPGHALRQVRNEVDAAYRAHPLAAQLFYASSVVAAGEQAEALCRKGVSVVIDRYWLSTLVYAQVRRRHLALSDVEACLPPADVTLLVELEETVRTQRLLQRGASVLDRETLHHDTAAKLTRGFRAALRRPVAGRGVVLDVTGLDPSQAVQQARRRIEQVASWSLAA